MESLSSLIRRTIREGAPLFNDGNPQGCFELYLETAKFACEQEKIAASEVGQLLEVAVDEATSVAGNKQAESKKKYSQAAWILRDAFDEILKLEKKKGTTTTRKPDTNTDMEMESDELSERGNLCF